MSPRDRKEDEGLSHGFSNSARLGRGQRTSTGVSKKACEQSGRDTRTLYVLSLQENKDIGD